MVRMQSRTACCPESYFSATESLSTLKAAGTLGEPVDAGTLGEPAGTEPGEPVEAGTPGKPVGAGGYSPLKWREPNEEGEPADAGEERRRWA